MKSGGPAELFARWLGRKKNPATLAGVVAGCAKGFAARKMILSYARQFLFIKTVKTAGTSVEVALSQFCGPNDIITPIVPEDEAQREKKPQNYMRGDTKRGLWQPGVLAPNPAFDFFNHIRLSEIAAYVGRNIVDNLFKFSIVRNPWERYVSLYHWQKTFAPQPCFSEWLYNQESLPVFDMLSLDGRVNLNGLIRFEHLQGDFDTACDRIGLAKLTLPVCKPNKRPGDDHRTYYDERTRAHVARLGQWEIEAFGYDFDQIPAAPEESAGRGNPLWQNE